MICSLLREWSELLDLRFVASPYSLSKCLYCFSVRCRPALSLLSCGSRQSLGAASGRADRGKQTLQTTRKNSLQIVVKFFIVVWIMSTCFCALISVKDLFSLGFVENLMSGWKLFKRRSLRLLNYFFIIFTQKLQL